MEIAGIQKEKGFTASSKEKGVIKMVHSGNKDPSHNTLGRLIKIAVDGQESSPPFLNGVED